MAEQYSWFQGREPNIDINLFPNAVSAGINQGNAQKTTKQGIVEGIRQTVSDVAAVITGVQGIQSNALAIEAQQNQNAINSDPAVQQARKDDIVAQAEIHQQQALALKGRSADLVKKAQAALALKQAEQEFGDLTAKDAINSALDDPMSTVESIGRLLQTSSGTLTRDTDFAQQAMARAQQRGVDPALIDNMRQAFDAVDIEKTRVRLAEADTKYVQQQALKNEEKIAEATSVLQLSPRVADVMNNGQGGFKYDPTKLDVVRAGNVELDPRTKQPKFDAMGKPVITDRPRDNDKRYYATYNGQVIDTYDEENGKEAAKSIQAYRLGVKAIAGNRNLGTPAAPPPPAPMQMESQGLAAEQYSINKRLTSASPAGMVRPQATISPAALEGKTPEQQAEMTASFNAQVQKLQTIPREYRETVARVNSNPALAGETPIIKALASQESGGVDSAKSPTGVKGLLQVTQGTFDYVANKYPKLKEVSKLGRANPQASVLVGKVYLLDMLTTFDDMQVALAAYNAGPEAIMAARNRVGKQATWEQIKEVLPDYLSAEKFKEVENYPEKVLKYYSFYNG